MVARVVPVEAFDLVVFGGTGDLARRKLLPALYHRMQDGQMPSGARIVGTGRSKLSRKAYQDKAREALGQFVAKADHDPEIIDAFIKCIDYVQVDAADPAGYEILKAHLDKDARPIRAIYLAVGPTFFAPISEQLKAADILTPETRLVVEKPLGHDLESAQALNRSLAGVIDEHHIYRIDHYLGKETVQNLMALRFANALFEPVWNSQHIDHVQITVAESVGVEGRGSYYDKSGALRDMVQNHILQLLCLTAMEPPSRFEPDGVRDEKLKVLRALEPLTPQTLKECVVRGQYAGRNGEGGYLEDAELDGSTTETFVALKVAISNWRWSGTPFYLRTGKKLRSRMSEIVVVFKDPPHSIFAGQDGTVKQNVLAIRLQPDEGITLSMTIKDPGPGGMRLTSAPLDMSFAQSLGREDVRMPDAYERLVMDVIRGDQTLFMRGDEVEAAWTWVDPIIDAWDSSSDAPAAYDSGGAGPDEALMLMHRDGRRWRDIAV